MLKYELIGEDARNALRKQLLSDLFVIDGIGEKMGADFEKPLDLFGLQQLPVAVNAVGLNHTIIFSNAGESVGFEIGGVDE